jgi:hypothetical protein
MLSFTAHPETVIPVIPLVPPDPVQAPPPTWAPSGGGNVTSTNGYRNSFAFQADREGETLRNPVVPMPLTSDVPQEMVVDEKS